jgi:polysaccharide chain length determinant protein (PEP-CTERM system associated)
MEEPRFDPFDYVSAFQRRKWWFIVPVAASILIGLLLVWLLPRTYQSTATLGVSNARVEAGLIGGAAVNRSERVRAISQQLLSRPVLERTVQLEGLGPDESLDEAVARLRSGVEVAFGESTIKGALTPDQRAALDAYTVSYITGSPDAAQRMLNRLVTVFVEENDKQRETRAQDTSEFIAVQLRTSEERLSTLEAKLREAKEAYMGRLPEQRDANLQMVQALQRQLESTATMMRGEQDRLSMIERQIEAMQQGADFGPVTGGAMTGNLQARVHQLRGELAQAQLVFTDKHPEVIRLKDELATAEKAAAAERERPVSDRVAVLQTNPEYRQLVKDREAANMAIARLRAQQAQAETGIRQYQGRVEAAPRVEQELVSLQRAYDLERAAYAELTEKRQAALLNEELQRNQGDERFAIIGAASFPNTPFAPKPMRVLLMAIAAGFVLGAAGVMGREYLDRSVHDARGLRDEFELPVLAEIPRIDPVIS